MDDYDNFIDYQAIREQVEWRLARRIVFFTHLVIFTFVSMTLNHNPFWKGAPLTEVGSVVWFILLMSHGGYWIYSELRDRAIRKAIERERKALIAQMAMSQRKARRGVINRLRRDEDILLDLDADDWQAEAKYKRG